MTMIRITGDVIRNTNLVRLPADASRSTGQLPHTSLRRDIGGAYYLARMIELSCSDLDATITGTGSDASMLPSGHDRCPEAVSIWARHERAVDSREWVWRVEQVLRTETIDPLATDGLDATLRLPLTTCSPGENAPRGSGSSMLVLDDENFDFQDDPSHWSPSLDAFQPDDHVVLKTRFPISIGAPWKELITRYADRLTVIVPVFSLRARHAAISRALSWDRTIEDVHPEPTRDVSATDIGRAHRVVVPFSYDGVAAFSRGARD